MRRVIVKEIRVTDGHRVTLGYDQVQGKRRWWANDVDPTRRVNEQVMTFVSSRPEAVSFFWELYQATRDVWFDENVSMFRGQHPWNY